VSPRALLTEEADREERDDRDRLRALEGRFEALLDRRRALIDELRRLSAEQRSLYERR
jgi:hypothetical protein